MTLIFKPLKAERNIIFQVNVISEMSFFWKGRLEANTISYILYLFGQGIFLLGKVRILKTDVCGNHDEGSHLLKILLKALSESVSLAKCLLFHM